MRKVTVTIGLDKQTEDLRDELLQVCPNLNKSTVFSFMADVIRGNLTLDDLIKHYNLIFKDSCIDGRRKL